VSSQAFVDRYGAASIPTLLPPDAKHGLDFVPTHPKAQEALTWMGFEARTALLDVLDQAIADTAAQVRVVAYDLNEPGQPPASNLPSGDSAIAVGPDRMVASSAGEDGFNRFQTRSLPLWLLAAAREPSAAATTART
jgi:hypothetical protein